MNSRDLVTLGEIADLQWGDTSVTKKSYVLTGDQHPAYSASGQDGYLPYFDYDRIGVVLSAIGANAGKTWLATGKWSCIKNTIRFFSNDESVADTRYLFWATQGQGTFPLRGSAQPFISQGDARKVTIHLPPIEEQRAIAATLGALDDKIESNRRAMAKALDLAQSHVNRATKNRELVPYGSALQVRMGSAFKGAFFSKPGVGRPLLRIRDLKTFDPQTWTTEVRSDQTVISPGDVVVGMDAEFRATLWIGDESVLNQRVCSFSGIGDVGRAFVMEALKPELAFQEQAKTGTTVIHLNKADIETFAVPSLTAGEHRALSTITEPLVDLAVARANETKRLVSTRDALLPELLSGRIRAADVEVA